MQLDPSAGSTLIDELRKAAGATPSDSGLPHTRGDDLVGSSSSMPRLGSFASRLAPTGWCLGPQPFTLTGSYFIFLISGLMQAIEKALFGRSLAEFADSVSYSRRVECIWQLIIRDYADAELSLEKAAQSCGISRSHLNALLTEKAGMSFHRLLTCYRLVQAAQMIQQKDYTFLEVALETGFDNVSNFGRHARRLLSMSPRELRRHLLESST